jgi:hypothetical protein
MLIFIENYVFKINDSRNKAEIKQNYYIQSKRAAPIINITPLHPRALLPAAAFHMKNPPKSC